MIVNQTRDATSTARLAGLGAAGIWLILLIVNSVAVAVIFFSATQFQTRLANLTVNGKALSVWKANQLREEWAANVKSLENAKTALQSARTAVEDDRQHLHGSVEDESSLSDQVYVLLGDLTARIGPVKPDIVSKVSEVNWLEVPAIVQEHVEIAKYPEIKEALDTFVVGRQKWLDASNKLKVAKARQRELEEISTKRSTELEQATKSASSLTGGDGSLENAIYEFQTMHDNYSLSYFVTLAPSDLLVLILVIAMGVLGACLQLSYVYTTEFSEKPISFYIFRPFLGVITALVIFIVAKAGIPLIADTNRVNANVPINPYFIAFVGIISGFMSERALQSLQQLGTAYFRDAVAREPARWARAGIREHFAELQRDPSTLKLIFEVDDTEMNAWLDGKKPTPKEAQVLISAILNVPRRDLFTDLPPAEEANTAA
jgi:hypothetical protein